MLAFYSHVQSHLPWINPSQWFQFNSSKCISFVKCLFNVFFVRRGCICNNGWNGTLCEIQSFEARDKVGVGVRSILSACTISFHEMHWNAIECLIFPFQFHYLQLLDLYYWHASKKLFWSFSLSEVESQELITRKVLDALKKLFATNLEVLLHDMIVRSHLETFIVRCLFHVRHEGARHHVKKRLEMSGTVGAGLVLLILLILWMLC